MDLGLDNDFESDDSFFEEPKLAKKPQPEKKSLEDIFSFEDKKSGQDSLENIPTTKPKVRFNIEESPSLESTKTKVPDWLDDSNDPEHSKKDTFLSTVSTKSESKKSFNLLDDILPQRSKRDPLTKHKTASFEDILNESKAKSEPRSLDLTSAVNEEKSGEGFNTILGPSRRGRQGSSTGVSDVLGLFGSSSETKNEKDIPDWLGGSSSAPINKSETTISTTNNEEDIGKENPVKPVVNKFDSNLQEPRNNDNFQNNISNLQAQESLLLVSLQLKKYEENLSEIKSQQQEILKKQENQFDLFLNKYIEKQKTIESEMLTQQERINDHIRMMALSSGLKQKGDFRDEAATDSLDKVISGLKQRHEEEFFLMEESYKKQITLLEKSSEKVEERLKLEIETATQLYEQKLENLKTQHAEEIETWTEKLKKLDQLYKKELEGVKANYSQLIREAKSEFLEQLERFKEQRTRENDLFGQSKEYGEKLDSSLNKLAKNEEILDHIQDKVLNDYNVLSIAREKSMETREKEINAMRVALENSRAQAEKDRSQLLGLVSVLERKLSEQSQNSNEERWALQQTAATLAARSAAFDREIEFGRASLEREREQLKTLKETLLAEQEKVALQFTEEKLKLATEKSRLEVSKRLTDNYEVEKVKAEAETAIQVAKELTDKLNLERNFLQRQKIDVDSFRNKLMERERELLEREESLEEAKRLLQQQSSENKRDRQETKHLENNYKEKLLELHTQTTSLANRERKLAEEKLLLSKERLALYTAIKAQKEHKKCVLCKAEDRPITIVPTDPELIKLRLEALEDERNSEVSREETTPK